MDQPWQASYPEGVPHSLAPFPTGSAYGMLAKAAERFPDRPATAFFGKRLTYQQLSRQVDQMSAVLAGMGVSKGDRVGVVLPNCPQYVITFYAAMRLGAVLVGNNPLYTHRELSHQLSDAGVKVIVCLDMLYPSLAEARPDITGTPPVIVTKITDAMPALLGLLAPIKFKKEAKEKGDPWPPVPSDAQVLWWRALMRDAGPTPPVADINPEQDPAVLIYTGGTTGPSKGAVLTHRNITANAMQGASWFPGITPGHEGLLLVLPTFHAFGLLGMNVAIVLGAKLCLLPRFDIDLVLKAIAKEKPTLFPGVPRIYIALNESPKTAKYDVRSIKACVSGAAPLPTAVAERFAEVTGGAQVVEGYGLTECSPVTHANPFLGERRPGSIGLPLPDTECKIIDLENPEREVAQGESGELCIRGPQVMQGYWNRPEETALMIRNGWLHTGDVATMDADGYFRIVDRLKDMVLISGFNVYPTEIEEVLYRNPKVEKCCVIGVPDAVTGEALKAFVVLREDQTATPEEIITWMRDPEHGLTGYRVPKQVEIRDALPETMIGKVLRRVLQEEERTKG